MINNRKINVLIVENQITQFRSICSLLDEKFVSVLPENNYGDFIDSVQVMLSTNPDMVAYRDTCKMKVLSKIKDLHPDIIILDHKLCGSTDCKTGVDMARILLQECPKEPKEPFAILFLSRTVENEKRRQEAYNSIQRDYKDRVRWLNKGFYGRGVLDTEYKEELNNALFELWHKSDRYFILEACQYLMEKESLDDKLKNMINKFKDICVSRLPDIPGEIYSLLRSKRNKDFYFNKEEKKKFMIFVQSLENEENYR